MRKALLVLVWSLLWTPSHSLSAPRAQAVLSSSSNLDDVSMIPPSDVPIGGAQPTPLSSQVFNLIKSIVGAGVLGLPAGIAAFGNAPSAAIPALCLLVCFGFLSGLGFTWIGRACEATGAQTYRQAWQKSVGKASWMPALACLLVTACTVLTYSMVLKDTVPALLEAFLGISVKQAPALIATTTLVLLPLCLQKELSKLAPVSLVGTAGMVYTSIVLVYRLVSGSYAIGGPLQSPYPAAFGSKGWKSVFGVQSTILISMLSTAFMSHYNAPKFYWEAPQQFHKLVPAGFGGATVLMGLIAIAGYMTFGGNAQALILNNYANDDSLISLARLAVTISLIGSYPLAFTGVRDGIQEYFPINGNLLTVGSLILLTFLALNLRDVRLVLSLGGATWGNCVIYLFPAYMMLKLKLEKSKAITTGVLGIILGIIGAWQALR